MDLRNLIEAHLDLPRLSKDLDELGHPGRLWSVHQWTRSDMVTLWDAAKGFRAISLDDFVPAPVQPLVEVIHHGKNSLPMFKYFEKHFCKPTGGDGDKPLLFGLNRQSMSPFTGPGYFVVHPSADEGEVDIDYTMQPKEKAASWPSIAPSNSGLIGGAVYGGLIDVMRGISSHVTIGRSKRQKGWIDNWFVLVREDSAPS